MNTITATVHGERKTLVLIGSEMDYLPRDFEETFKGYLGDDVYMDPTTRMVYVERYMYANRLVEYNFDRPIKIEYLGSKFISCALSGLLCENTASHSEDTFDQDFNDPFDID